jgi:deoxyhypusine synthase
MVKRTDLLKKPIKQIDLEKTETVHDLVEAFKGASIQARALGECATVWENMLKDRDRPTVILGLSGALIAGGMRKVIRDMVKYRLVDVIASTGAVMYQDFYQAMGYQHFKGDPTMDDVQLRKFMIDRIYDTLVDEVKFEETDRAIAKLTEKLEPRAYSSREVMTMLGKAAQKDDNSILGTAYNMGVPIFSPALNDSSIGIGLTIYHVKNRRRPHAVLDSIKDNYELLSIIYKSKKTSAVYIGGGTPKNWVNDGVVMANYTSDREIEGHSYAIQLTTDSPHWGGLSGSTLKEAQSWGKVHKEATKAMAHVEATIGLPLLVGHLVQSGVWKGRKSLKFDWDKTGDLRGIKTA